MGKFKTDSIYYPNRWQSKEDLIADGYYYATKKPSLTIEIAAHLMADAFINHDDETFKKGLDLMHAANSPCVFLPDDTTENATDNNNRPSEPIVPDVPEDLLNGCVEEHRKPHKITWEERKQCFKNAVLHVMKREKKEGGYLFKKNTQWKAVYRFSIDKIIMYDLKNQNASTDSNKPYAFFANLAHELQLDDNSSIRIPFMKVYIEEMNKENYTRYNKRYPWSKDGINHASSFVLYTELEDVYIALKEEYNNLVSQAQKASD